MPWQDRLQPAAYTTARGNRLEFLYEDVSLSFSLRGSAFEFPDAEGTYVQRTGASSRRYPMRVFFAGGDHDLQANDFEDFLRAPGIGRLDHPLYGSIQVVPFGDVARRDDLKTAANQTVFEVTFWNTLETTFPTNQEDPGSAVLGALADFGGQAAQQFLDTLNIGDANNRAQFQTSYQSLQATVTGGLASIAAVTESVRDEFQTIDDSINQSIDVLVRDPLTLGAQTIALIEVPSRSAAAIVDRLNAYRGLADTIISGERSVVPASFDPAVSNAFHTRDLYASTYVAGAIRSVVNNEFQTRPEALEAAEFLLDFSEQVTNWRDDNYESLGETDTGGQYQQLQEAVAIAAGFLVQISFTLKQERSLVLTRNRTPIDLCAELYGQVDEVLNFFAQSNSLSWQEHLELQAGRRIVYYV